MKKYRFHLVTLAHLPQSKEYMSCAFTQKNLKMAKMLTSLGHEVFFYGSEGSDVLDYCKGQPGIIHYIETHKLVDIAADYGDGDNRFEIGYDWKNSDFRHDFNEIHKPSTNKFKENTIKHINKVKKPDDFLLLSQGSYQQEIRSEVGLYLNCEFGIGYRGAMESNFRAFESAYIQNFTYGSEHPRACINGSFYDRVIPNYFEPEDFEVGLNPKDYFLFIGRMIKRKGIITAAETCKALGKKLIIVGQGAKVHENGHLIPNEDPDFDLAPGTWEYLGYADVAKRKELMSNAIATFTPTEYLECFAGTHVESRLSGTPVITTNFAVFGGTVENGLDGYRCDTLDDFVWAAKNIGKLDRALVRKRAERYLMENVRWDFQKWFDDLYDVYLSSVSDKPIGWHNIRESEPEWRNKIKW